MPHHASHHTTPHHTPHHTAARHATHRATTRHDMSSGQKPCAAARHTAARWAAAHTHCTTPLHTTPCHACTTPPHATPCHVEWPKTVRRPTPRHHTPRTTTHRATTR